MDEISRRNLVAIGGAGLALAACGEKGQPEKQEHTKFGMLGTDEDWGVSPMFDPDASDAEHTNFKGKFKPRYLALVHVKPQPDWTLRIDYGCVKISTSLDGPAREALALEIFRKKVENGKIFDFDDLKKSYPDIYEFKDSNRCTRSDLKNFRFSKQAEIYFFFDTDEWEFNSDCTMKFTSLLSTGQECKKNYSFFAAELLDKDVAGLPARGRVIRLRNYCTNENAQIIGSIADTKQYLYSMNILFTIKTASGQPIQMIFDPDTGNGTGYEP